MNDKRGTIYDVRGMGKLLVVGCRGFLESRDMNDIRGSISRDEVRYTRYEGFLLLSTVYYLIPTAYCKLSTAYFWLLDFGIAIVFTFFKPELLSTY
jgi:hypothetical protein